MLTRYDKYTTACEHVGLPYDTYYTWLSYYNADNHSSDEIVDNDTDTDSNIEHDDVESDDNDDDDDNDVPRRRINPVLPVIIPLTIPRIQLDNPVSPVVIPAVIPVAIPVVNAQPVHIDLTLRNDLIAPSIHTRVFTDLFTPPARNTRTRLAHQKSRPRSPTPKKAKPSAQPSLFPTR